MIGIAITRATTNSHCIVLTSLFTLAGLEVRARLWNQPEEISLYPHHFSYLHYHLITPLTDPASAVILISNL